MRIGTTLFPSIIKGFALETTSQVRLTSDYTAGADNKPQICGISCLSLSSPVMTKLFQSLRITPDRLCSTDVLVPDLLLNMIEIRVVDAGQRKYPSNVFCAGDED